MFYIELLEQVGVKNFLPRFWSRIDIDPDPFHCWEWQGSISSDGYGNAYGFGRCINAHRMALLMCGISLSSSIVVMHDCDNPLCCNPMHLTPGTQLQNVRDCIKKGRRRYKKA